MTMDPILMLIATSISIGVTFFLSVYMGVQSFIDKDQRRNYLFFFLIWTYLGVTDILFLLEHLPPNVYELLRLVWGVSYVHALMGFFGVAPRIKHTALLVLTVLSGTAWAWSWNLATSLIFPLVFLSGAFFHYRHFQRKHGFASVVLGATSLAMGLMCSLYAQVQESGTHALLMGYLHYATLSLIMVLFGWIQFPRELTGRFPVTVSTRMALFVAVSVMAGEALIQGGLLADTVSHPLFAAGQSLQLCAILVLYFSHRHALVVFTDNVARLLDERTASLRETEARLKEANSALQVYSGDLESMLAKKTDELKEKIDTLERQRRLELAAQTAGGIAHDIQNSVTPMLHVLETMGREAHMNSRSRELAVRLRNYVENVLEMNGQLLALSRRGGTHTTPVNLVELIQDVTLQDPLRDIRCDLREPHVWIRGSWSQLHRVLNNLIINALESYEGYQGLVEVSCSSVTLAEPRRIRLSAGSRPGLGHSPGCCRQDFRAFFLPETQKEPVRIGTWPEHRCRDCR